MKHCGQIVATHFLEKCTEHLHRRLWSTAIITIVLAIDNMFHAHAKHIGIRYHLIRTGESANGKITVKYIPTNNNTADIIKPLGKAKLRPFEVLWAINNRVRHPKLRLTVSSCQYLHHKRDLDTVPNCVDSFPQQAILVNAWTYTWSLMSTSKSVLSACNPSCLLSHWPAVTRVHTDSRHPSLTWTNATCRQWSESETQKVWPRKFLRARIGWASTFSCPSFIKDRARPGRQVVWEQMSTFVNILHNLAVTSIPRHEDSWCPGKSILLYITIKPKHGDFHKKYGENVLHLGSGEFIIYLGWLIA